MKNEIKKNILMLLCATILTSSNREFATNLNEPETKIIMTEKEDYSGVAAIIEQYDLYNQEQYILEDKETFFRYYNIVQNNSSFSYQDQEAAMKDFWLISNKEEKEIFLNKISKRQIIIDEERLKKEKSEGKYDALKEQIIVKENTSSYIRSRENKRHLLDHKEKSQLQLDNKTISAKPIIFAVANDLAAQDYSQTGFPIEQTELNLVLQALYNIYGRENFVKSCFTFQFLESFLKDLQKSGMRNDDINLFFQHIKEMYELPKEENKEKKDYLRILLCDDILKIYELKNSSKLVENKEMQAICYALVCDINIEKLFSHKIQHKQTIKDIRENPSFLNNAIYQIENAQKMNVVVDSKNQNWAGTLCLNYQIPTLSGNEVIQISFEGNILSSTYNYNANILTLSKHLQENYGIDDFDTAETYYQYYDLFRDYEKQILELEFLDLSSKKDMIIRFKHLLSIHSVFFESISSKETFQELLKKAIEECQTKEELQTLLKEEKTLYEKSCQEKMTELSLLGIEKENQKYYIQNEKLFQSYYEALKNNIYIQRISSEDFQELLKLFPNYMECSSMLKYEQSEDCDNLMKEELEMITYKRLLQILYFKIKEPINMNGRARILYV